MHLNMWGWSNQQRHARDAGRNIALTMFFAGGVSPYLWLGFLIFIGWLNGWFSWFGFSLQASAPAVTPTDYYVRGLERIKNPFAWDDGVEDIRTAIRLDTNKMYLSNDYWGLAKAYGIRGDKSKALHYLQIASQFDRQFEAEATNEVDRKSREAFASITKEFIRRCVESDCKHW